MSEVRLLPVYCSFVLSVFCLLAGASAVVSPGTVTGWSGLGFLMFSGVSLAVAVLVTLWFGIWQWKTAPRSIRFVAVANLIMPIASIFAFIRYAR